MIALVNPVTISTVIAGIQALVTAAPKAAAVIKSAKDMIAAMFDAGLITKEQQDALNAFVDGNAALAAAGIVPPAWQVRPDPV
jgi:hypothetical protein